MCSLAGLRCVCWACWGGDCGCCEMSPVQGELEALRASTVDAESAAAAVTQRDARIAELQEQVGVAMGNAEEAQQAALAKEERLGSLREEAQVVKADHQRVMEELLSQERAVEGLRGELAAAQQQLQDATAEAAEKLAGEVEAAQQQGAAEVAALVASARGAEGVIAGLQAEVARQAEVMAQVRREGEERAAEATAAAAAAAATPAVMTPVKAAQAGADGGDALATPSPAKSSVSAGAAEDVGAIRKKLHQAIRKGKAIQSERDELKAQVAQLAGEAAELREQVRADREFRLRCWVHAGLLRGSSGYQGWQLACKAQETAMSMIIDHSSKPKIAK